MSWIRTPVPNRHNCPGIKDFTRPTVRYLKCHVCGGNVELWSDEDEGICIACGAKWTQPEGKASCLDYCKYADQCRNIINSR